MKSDSIHEGKVVYVLGAGFSITAGAPLQSEILADILKLRNTDERAQRAIGELRRFLDGELQINLESAAHVALEDIYTPLDRCISDGTSLKNYTPDKLRALREDLGYLISLAISLRIESAQAANPTATDYIRDFAHYVVTKAAMRAELAHNAKDTRAAKGYDPLSIICLNWDILLDNFLHRAMEARHPDAVGDYDPFGVVDYCCYVSSLDVDDVRVRSGLWSLGCRGYNVKLLKPHGSMNWLQCPNCQRLFVQFGEKRQILARIDNEACRHCLRAGYSNNLTGSLVMPTFLKDLRNFQIKLVWQNTGVELMEARRLVFIGYSLPQADFEFRQLLSRMVHKEAVIDIVLYEGTGEEKKRKYAEETDRYRHFFGNRVLRFHPAGAAHFLEDHIQNESAT